MFTNTSLSKSSLAIIISLITSVLILGLWMYSQAENSQITACATKTGNLYLIGDSFLRKECKRNDVPISWNKQGWDEARIIELEARIAALEALHPEEPESVAIVEDDFNSYMDGSIVGQGSWIYRVNGDNFLIQGTTTQEGTKAIYNNAIADSVTTKTGTARTDGKQVAYVRTENRNDWGTYDNGNVQIRLSKGSWDSDPMTVVSFKKDGNVAFYDPISDTYTNFAAYNDNEWTLLEIEWRSSDKTARYRINSGVWTDWKPFRGAASFTDFDTVGFDFVLPSGAGGVYFDNLQ